VGESVATSGGWGGIHWRTVAFDILFPPCNSRKCEFWSLFRVGGGTIIRRFRKFGEPTIAFVMSVSVRPPAWNNSAPTLDRIS